MPPLLRVENVSRSFGGLLAVSDVSFEQSAGEIVGIIGPNGAGKSTLFNMIGGMIRPSSGRIWFDGQRIDRLPVERVARLGVLKTFQTSRPFNTMSLLENVMTAAFARTRQKDEARQIALEKLEQTGLAEVHANPARGASTGQRKRLEIARLLAVEPRLLLLDEPFGGVDMVAIEGMIDLLQSIRRGGQTILVIEHNLAAVSRLAGRLIAMNLGRVIADGAPEAVTRNAAVVSAYLGEEPADNAVA